LTGFTVLGMTIRRCQFGSNSCHTDGSDGGSIDGLSIQDSALGAGSLVSSNAPSSVSNCTIINTRADFGSYDSNTLAGAVFEDSLIETGSATGLYKYLDQNTKRRNNTYSPDDTGVDMTSTATITFANPATYAVQYSSTLQLTNLNADVETFSIAVTSATGMLNTFSHTKPDANTSWDIPIAQMLGDVAIGADYVITIISDNTSQTNVSYTLAIIEQAVL
jgi:hypothetical protein